MTETEMDNDNAIFAEFHNYSLGQPLRIEVIASESSATKARALSVLRQKVLSVVVFSGANEKEFCRLTATLPHKADGELLQRCIVPYGDRQVKVMLDLAPESHKTLLLLIEEFYGQPQKMRMEFYAESELAVKAKRESKPQKEPNPYGRFWQALDLAGFHNRPDVRRWIECADTDGEWEAKARLRLALGVQKRSLEASPDFMISWLERDENLSGAITMVRKLAAETAGQNLPGIAAIAKRLGETERR